MCYSLGTIEVTDRIQFKSVLSQYAEWILNKVAKTFKETFVKLRKHKSKVQKNFLEGQIICQLGNLANLAKLPG